MATHVRRAGAQPLFVLVIAALASLLAAGSARAQERTAATVRPVTWTDNVERCQFSRIAIRPGADEFLLWLDRRPLFRAYNGYYPASTIAWVRRDAPTGFLSLGGEVSALNWMENGDAAEFLLDGKAHHVLSPESGSASIDPVGYAWRHIGIKNLRWGGLSAALEDRALTRGMPQERRAIARRRGYVLSAERREYHANAPERGPVPPSTLDRFYPETAYAGAQADVAAGPTGLPARPVFDARTGRIAGWQDARSTYALDGREWPLPPDVRGGLILDAVALGDARAVLAARPDGSHWISVIGSARSWSKKVCGPPASGYVARWVTIVAGGIAYPALLHSTGGPPEHLVVRFHGGPFGSILDDYPSTAARRVTQAGGALLEVSSPGSRHEAQVPSPRVDPRRLRTYSRALSEWVAEAGYASATVLGESFGAVGALDYALADQPRVGHLVLMVPLTLFDPELSLAGSPLARGGFQSTAEAVILGEESGRRQFARWLEESVARACRSLSLSVLVGAQDTTTPAERQAACAQERMTVVPFANHATVQHRDEAWSWLGREEKPDAGPVRDDRSNKVWGRARLPRDQAGT